MRRVLVIGSPGAGKSTLARQLAERLRLPLIHLDELCWNTNWRKVEHGLWRARLDAALATDCWVLDGNFSSTLLKRAYRADTVVLLRPPRWLCLWRAFLREFLGRHPHGHYQAHWPSRALLQDIWHFGSQAEWELAHLKTVPQLIIVVLASGDQTREWLEQLGTAPSPSGVALQPFASDGP